MRSDPRRPVHRRTRSAPAIPSLALALAASLTIGVGAMPGAARAGSTTRTVQDRAAHALTAGGTLRTAFDADFSTMDPAVGYDPFAWTGEHAVFEGLLDYRGTPGQAGTALVPRLAASLPAVSRDGLRYTFTLRHGVRFQQPVGREVTADDVRYSIERALSPRTAGAAMYQSPFWSALQGVGRFWSKHSPAAHISGITVHGRDGITFRLSTPDRAFLNVLAMPFTSVVPREWVARYGTHFGDHALGTGPFVLQSWTHGQRMVLARNPAYFRAGVPALDHVQIDFNVADHLQVQRVQAGALDVGGNLVTGDDFLSLQGRASSAATVLTAAPDIAVNYLAFNLKQNPFAGNLALRRAVNLAINKRFILRLLNGRGVVMAGVLPPTMPGADTRFSYYPYDPTKAAALLRQAGYRPGALHLALTYQKTPDYDKVATEVQSELSAIGIVLVLHPVSSSNWYGGIAYNAAKEGALVLAPWGQDYPDPSDFFDPILSCNGSSNAASYCNPAVDKLGDQARGLGSTAARYALYRRMERMVMADAPWVPLYDGVLYDVHGPRLKHFYIHPVWPFVYADYTVR